LLFHAGRRGQRPQQVEDGAHLDLAAHLADMAHGGVMHLGKQENDPGLGCYLRGALRFQVDLHPQRFKDVGRAAFGGGRAVAMLGHRYAGPRHHERYGGRYIKCAMAVAAGSAQVDGVCGGGDRAHAGAHRPDRAHDLRHGGAARRLRGEEGNKIGVTDGAAHDGLERPRRGVGVQAAAFAHDGQRGGKIHRGACYFHLRPGPWRSRAQW
jgi:hypothetical protein